MSKMVQLVEELRERLNTIADGEQKLVSSLREALNRFDQKLLQDVRSITAEHEFPPGCHPERTPGSGVAHGRLSAAAGHASRRK